MIYSWKKNISAKNPLIFDKTVFVVESIIKEELKKILLKATRFAEMDGIVLDRNKINIDFGDKPKRKNNRF